MKKILYTLVLLTFACSGDLFSQDYMKMNKKNLRVEYQKKLNKVDSLIQVLDITYSKNQNLQSNLKDANNDLVSISDSLNKSNLEISQLEVKLLNSKNKLSQLATDIDNLVKQNSDNLDLITDKNLQIDSLRTSLNIFSDEKMVLVSQDSLKNTIINSLKKENEELLMTVNDRERELIKLDESIKKFSAQKIDLDKWAGITLLPLSSCVSKIDVYQTGYWEFFKGYDDGKYYLGEFEVAYEIESILYNQFSDVFTVNMTGKVTSEGDEWQDEPYKVTIKRLNGKFYINSGKTNQRDETIPYVACENVEQVWGMD